MLLTNGRIYTLGPAGTVVDTLVVRDGRVAFAGRRGDVNPAPREEIVDLDGRAALPGLVDAHGHLMHLARVRLTLERGQFPFRNYVAAAGRSTSTWERPANAPTSSCSPTTSSPARRRASRRSGRS